MFENKEIKSRVACLEETLKNRFIAASAENTKITKLEKGIDDIAQHLDKIYKRQDALAEYLGVEFCDIPTQWSKTIVVKKQIEQGSE